MERKTSQQNDRMNKNDLMGKPESSLERNSGIPETPANVLDYAPNDERMNEDIKSLREELQTLKNSMAAVSSHAASSTMGMASDAAAAVSSKVSDAASMISGKTADVASAASSGVQSLSGEIEVMTRRNPLAALAGAAVLGMLIGMMSRGRN